MAVLTIHVQIGQTEPRSISIDTDDLTLGFMEDMETARESGRWRDMIPVIAGMLGLQREEARDITQGQWRQIATALKEAAESPNENG